MSNELIPTTQDTEGQDYAVRSNLGFLYWTTTQLQVEGQGSDTIQNYEVLKPVPQDRPTEFEEDPNRIERSEAEKKQKRLNKKRRTRKQTGRDASSTINEKEQSEVNVQQWISQNRNMGEIRQIASELENIEEMLERETGASRSLQWPEPPTPFNSNLLLLSAKCALRLFETSDFGDRSSCRFCGSRFNDGMCKDLPEKYRMYVIKLFNSNLPKTQLETRKRCLKCLQPPSEHSKNCKAWVCDDCGVSLACFRSGRTVPKIVSRP